MKHRVPDIKTADAFFEIISNQDNVLTQIGNMRRIRDEIVEALGVTATVDAAAKLSQEASNLMANAKEAQANSIADMEASSAQLAKDIDNHKVEVDKDRAQIVAAKRTQAALKTALDVKEKNLDAIVAAMVAREEKVLARESKAATRESNARAKADRMAEVQKAMDNV